MRTGESRQQVIEGSTGEPLTAAPLRPRRVRGSAALFLAAMMAVVCFATDAIAGTVTLTWDASASEDVVGYVVVYGTAPGNYPYTVSAGNHTFVTVDGLAAGVTYYFAVRAYSTLGGLSPASNEVSFVATNEPPILSDPGPQVSVEGTPVHLQLSASDPDNDQLVFSASGLPAGLFIDSSSGIVFGTPTFTASGVHQVTLSVSDGFLDGTQTTSRTVVWTVTNINGPPAIVAIPNQTNAENQAVTLYLSAADPDGETVSWSAVGLPPGLTIDSTGAITGTPTYTSAGTYPVTVIATAGGLMGRRNFIWTITNVDRPPVLAPIPTQVSGQYASGVLLTVTAVDPDGDPVTFSAQGLPTGLTIDATGRIVGTLTPASLGSYSVTVTATANGLTNSRGFIWTVTSQIAFPVKASANGRYLVDQNNVPFLMHGDAPQTIIGNLSVADATTFLTDRKARGFNTVWINLICRTVAYACSTSGSTFDGIAPFTTANDLSTPNEAYFARADAILNVARSLNLLVVLDPIDTGGWINTLQSNSLANVRAYGQYVGNRYKNFDNIVWMSGNDFQSWNIEAYDSKAREVALGIKDVDTRHIHTVELDFLNYSSSSLDDPTWAPIIGLEGAYTYYPTYYEVLKGYNRPSFLPVFMVEGYYEGEDLFGADPDVPQRQRRQEYWTALSGATGQLFGNHYTWTFLAGWQSNLNTPGAIQFGYLKSLLEPRSWFKLVPDQAHRFVTAGYGTYATLTPGTKPSGINSISGNDYATAAATPDGSLVMAYLPTVRTITVDMSQLSGPAVARWFDPTLGTFVAIPGSPFTNSGSASFTPPGTHADGAADWVLVLESNPGIVFQNPGNRTNPAGATISLQLVASDPYANPLTYSATNLPLNLTIDPASGLITGTLAQLDQTYNVTVTVTDGSLTASRSFTWTVTTANAPPVLTNPGNQTGGGGTKIALQLIGNDPDGVGLFYTATGLPPGLTLNNATGLISGTLSNTTAIYSVTATVSDGVLSNSQTFTWTVTLGSAFVQSSYSAPSTPSTTVTVPFTSAQTAGNLNVVVVGWNDTTRHVQTVTDTSGNSYVLAVGPTTRTTALTQSIYYAKNIVAAAAGGNSVTVTFDGGATFPDVRIAEYRGLDPVNPVDVVGAGQGSSTPSSSGAITTTNANDVLVAANVVTSVSTGAGVGFTMRVLTSPDADILEDQVVNVAGSYTATAQITSGNWVMQVVAFRAAGGALNQPPTLNVIPDQTSAEAVAVSLQAVGGDPDGNPITYSATNLPPGLSINAATGAISGTLSYASAGIRLVTVTVSDYSLTTSRTFTWTVTNTNRPPVIVPIADRMDLENTSVSFSVPATDPDLDALTYSATGLPPELTINPTTGVISGAFSYTSAGTHVVTVTVNDGQGAANSTASTTFYWTVTNANRPPVIAVIPDRTDAENTPITLSVIATDPDSDDILSYSAIGLPKGMSINQVTGVISGTLSFKSAGPHLVTVKVFDGTDTVSRSFLWTVTDVNFPPVLAPIVNQTSDENTNISLTVSATDIDGDTITYVAAGLPTGLAINPSSGVISGHLSFTSAGTYSVTVTASDGTLTATQNFTWTVNDVNLLPVFAASGNLTTVTETVVSLPVSATDLDGDTITYTASGLPPGVAINGGTGLIAGTPSTAGSYPVTVVANDGKATVSESFVWTVTTDPPGRVTFIQAHSSSVVDTAPSVGVSYPSAQLAGSLGVVVVGWKDPAAQVLSVTDTIGNLYHLATGPTTRPDVGSQSIYYAANVAAAAAGANVVTVAFTAPAQKAEVRVVEYQGIEPANVVDVTAGAQGSSGEASTGPVTTVFRNDLLFGAVWSSWATTTPEDGRTARLMTPSGTLLEDATVSAVGSYTVRASVVPPSPWIIQMVAFRDANHAPTLTNPGAQSGHTDAPVSLSLSASDVDSDPLTFSATGLPAGLSINAITGVISGTPGGTSTIVYNPIVSVFDGVLTASTQFLWTVTAPTVSANTSLLNPGASPSVTWASILTPTPTDWIGLYTPGAVDTAPAIWWRITGTSSGSLLVTLPTTLAPGTYELRLFANATYRRLASSGAITVAAPTLSAGPATLGAGGTVIATWSGIGTPTATDWITLAKQGTPDSSYVAWGYTNGTGSGSRGIVVPASATPGTYELRLFAQNTMRRLAVSNTFTVEGVAVTAGPASLAPGGTVTINWSGIGVPSTADWVVLAPAGAADSAYIAWGYTNGASSGSRTLTVPKTAVPGNYEVRLLANNTFKRLAVSNTIVVLPVTLTASPSTLAPGGTLTLSWQNIGLTSSTDWFVIVPVGAPDANWLAWIYGTGRANDSTLFNLPTNMPAGDYEVRLLANNTFKRLANSNQVTVTASGATLATSPVSTTAGGTLTASWRNITGPTSKDWVGLYPAGATDASFLTKTYTNGRATDRMLIALPGDVSTGSYELRLFANDTLTRLATSNGFEVTANARVSASVLTVKAGGALTVAWAGIATPTATDWVGLVAQNGADNTYVAWRYTNGAASGSVVMTIPASVPAGTYELRLFAQNTFQRLAVGNLIKVGPTLSANPIPAAPGGTLTVAWAGIPTPTPKDWLALVPLNAPDNNWVAWAYTDSAASGSKTFPIPSNLAPGSYDVRLFANDTFTRLALSNVLTIASGPSVSMGTGIGNTTATFHPGDTISALWRGIVAPSPTDWVGIYQAGAADGAYVARVNTNGQAIGSSFIVLPSGLAPGQYELRLFSNDSTRLAVSNSFAIQ